MLNLFILALELISKKYGRTIKTSLEMCETVFPDSQRFFSPFWQI